MTNQAVVAIVIRLAGILMAVEGVRIVVYWVVAMQASAPSSFWVGTNYGMALLWLVVSATLICVPGFIARKLLPAEHRDGGTVGWNVDDFQAAAFSAVGVFLVATTLTDWSNWVTAWHLATEIADRRPAIRVGEWNVAHVVWAFARLAIGVWLLFGAKGLRGLLRKARTAGLK